ncbi:MAG: tRNA pseudouridine(55) synthase TruB [Acidobacteriota bacterium]|nr:tRNA pseudouridine(55) synthase TruB [Acidobacteriota bacterium]
MLDGLLIIDKPEGPTSHDVVAGVRRILKVKRVGHTGTLDPFATGVLVVLTGRATRLAQFLSGAEKEYQAVVRFGYATDTGDSTGEPKGEVRSPEFRVQSTESDHWIEAALVGLRGEIEQVPPMYSAKKVQGRKLYEMARRGVEVERKAVRVVIHELEAEAGDDGSLLSRNEDGTYDLSVRVVCSAGTYIRTLAEAIGERLGVPAHLASLRRTRAGNFFIKDAIALDELREKVEAGQFIIQMDAALSRLPFVHLTADEARKTLHGVALRVQSDLGWAADQPIRMRDASGALIAVGFYDAANRLLRPRVVLFPEK